MEIGSSRGDNHIAEISSSMTLFLNETMFQPGGAMNFRPLSCLNRGLTLSLNNHFYLYSPEFSVSGDIFVLASSDLTEVEQLFVAVKMQVFRMHVLYFLKYKID